MRKYQKIFSISFQNEFVYRLNFILWRFRNVLRVLMTIYLWEVIFTGRSAAFGYSKEQMLGYVFLVLVVQTLVIAAPSNDNIGSEISNGDLSNILVKPVSYLKYWFTRDLSSKLLNFLFSLGEITLLILLFKPHVQLSLLPVSLLAGIAAWTLGILIFFFITKIAVFAAFWIPENTWGLMFIILVLLETLSGSIFPLDVLPRWAQTALQLTPFPYLIYYPIGIFVGRITGFEMFRILFQSGLWLIVSVFFTQKIWKAGLKTYSAYGR